MKALQIDHKNLPTPAEESWKYTNLPRAVPHGLKRHPDEQERIIHIPRGQVRDKPEDILLIGEDNFMHHVQFKIVVEDGAEVTVIERHEGQGSYWKNMNCEIEIGKNARLHHIRIQQDSLEGVNTNMVHMTLARDAHYDGFSLNMGGKLTRHQIHAVLQGENVECHFNGVNLLNGKQHGDTTILLEHVAPHCNSNQFYRTILDDEARGVFQGKVHVHKEAQKTDGYQMSNALLLSPKAEMDTKPELEIYADDVLCSHGATTGQLDEGPLFYLRSRGLTEPEARMLLAQAFIDEVTAKIGNENIKFEIERHAHAWLKDTLKK